MVVKSIIDKMLPNIWPMIAFISIIIVTLRCAYLFRGSRRFVLHKEILSLIFIIYILCLYYILIGYNDDYAIVNLIPFNELFKYEFGSYKFMEIIISNILLFLPFGFFSSYFLNNKKASLIFIVSLVVLLLIDWLRYYLGMGFIIDCVILRFIGCFIGYLLYIGLMAIKSKLPRFMKSDAFLNIFIILLIILVTIFSFDINIFNYL